MGLAMAKKMWELDTDWKNTNKTFKSHKLFGLVPVVHFVHFHFQVRRASCDRDRDRDCRTVSVRLFLFLFLTFCLINVSCDPTSKKKRTKTIFEKN